MYTGRTKRERTSLYWKYIECCDGNGVNNNCQHDLSYACCCIETSAQAHSVHKFHQQVVAGGMLSPSNEKCMHFNNYCSLYFFTYKCTTYWCGYLIICHNYMIGICINLSTLRNVPFSQTHHQNSVLLPILTVL